MGGEFTFMLKFIYVPLRFLFKNNTLNIEIMGSDIFPGSFDTIRIRFRSDYQENYVEVSLAHFIAFVEGVLEYELVTTISSEIRFLYRSKKTFALS